MKIYDILGKEVFVLVNEKLQAGKYKIPFSSNQLPSGIYYYKIDAGDFVKTMKMVLLK